MNFKKFSVNGLIPMKILNQYVDVYLTFLTKAINHVTNENIFPVQLKKSAVIKLYKKEDPLKKKNYRPIAY